jgi:hypothetical protein
MTSLDVAAANRWELSTLSWGAIIAGALTSAALTLLLAALGVGLGLSSVSPWAGEGVSTTTFKVGAGIYLVCVSMIASALGGYLAGRLRTKWAEIHDHEIYFRDTACGLAVWALATVLTAGVLGAATTHILAGAAAGLAPAAATATSDTPTDGYVDALLRVETPTARSEAASEAAGANVRGELRRIIVPALAKGADVSPANRTYVAKVVSARTGLSQADAERRVSEVITNAKKAADDARRAAASLALWFAGAMLAGAVASMLGAVEGGFMRDARWYEPNWRQSMTRTHI